MFYFPDGGVTLGLSPQNFTCMSADGQRTKWCRNIAENFNLLSRVHERYRQTTDDRRTADDIANLRTWSHRHRTKLTYVTLCLCSVFRTSTSGYVVMLIRCEQNFKCDLFIVCISSVQLMLSCSFFSVRIVLLIIFIVLSSWCHLLSSWFAIYVSVISWFRSYLSFGSFCVECIVISLRCMPAPFWFVYFSTSVPSSAIVTALRKAKQSKATEVLDESAGRSLCALHLT